MQPEDLRALIKEAVQEVLKESPATLDALTDGVSTSTITGEHWNKLVRHLESVIEEVRDFQSMYSSRLHGPTPNVAAALTKLKEVVRLMVEIKPTILGMDDIQRKDMSEGHPHGRYAQQAGATPFEVPQDF